MGKGIITRKDLITDEALRFGAEYAKNVQIAIETNAQLVQSVIKLNELAKNFKAGEGQKAFLEAKEQEIKISKQLEDLLKKESATRLSLEREKQASLVTAKKEIDLANKKAQQQRKNNKLTIDERVSLQLKNKEARQDAILTNKLVGAYQKLNLQRTKAKQALQDSVVQLGKSNVKTKQAQIEFDRLDKKVKVADLAVRDFSKNVGNYPNDVGRAVASLKKLASALGVVGGVALLGREIKKSVEIVKQFELQIATLGGISGATENQLDRLRLKAIQLGSTTEFTATQVAELETEFARLGFAPEVIEQIIEPTLRASTALGSDLAESAILVGSTLKAFDIDASNTSHVTDVLASSTINSALNFEKLSTGLAIVAPVAKNANVSLEKTTAQLGTLSDRGIDASTSATGLRNIFLEVAKRGITVEQAFKKINDSTNKNATAMALFGKRGATVATVLAENQKQTEKLTVALIESGGTAEDIANKKLATLDGSLKLLSSAWEGFILKLNETTGASNGLSKTILFLANNLDTIAKVIGYSTGIWVLYKVAILSVGLAKKVAIGYTTAYRLAVIAMNRGLISSVKSVRLLRVALINSGIGAFAVALGAVVFAFYKWNEASKETAKRVKEISKSITEEQVGLNKLVNSITDVNIKEEDRKKLINELNKKYPEFLKNIDAENLSNAELKKQLSLANDQYIKKLSIKQLEAKLDLEGNQKKLAVATSDNATASAEYSSALVNVKANLSALGTEVERVTGAQENQYQNLVRLLDTEIRRIEVLRNRGKASKSQLSILKTLKSNLNAVNGLRSKATGLSTQEFVAKEKVLNINKEISLLEERIGLNSNKNKNEAIELDEIIIRNTDKKNKASQKASKKRFELKRKEEKSLLELNKFRIQQEIKDNKEILKDEERLSLERIIASENISAKRKEIATLETEFILKNLGEFSNTQLRFIQELSEEEISEIISSNDIKADLQKKLSSEQLLIIEKFYANKKEADKQANEEQESLSLFDEKKFKKQLETASNLKQKALNKELIAENNRFNSLSDIEKRREQRTGAHEKRIADIKKKYAIEALEAQEEAISQLLQSSNLSAKQREKFEVDLSKIQLEISDLKKKKTLENEKVTANQILDIASQLTDALGNLANAIFEGKIQKIDEEIESENKKFESLLENENLSDEERKSIEAKREKRQEELNKKKKKEQRKQAILNKSLAVVDAGIATALGIMQAYAQLGPIGGSVGAALVAALGAVNIAAIIAKPIPKFAKGHLEGTYEGEAITNDGGRAEVWERDGKAKIIQGTNTHIMMKKGDKIHKSVDDYKNLMNASIMTSFDIENQKLNDFQAGNKFKENLELLEEMKGLRSDMNKKKPIHVHTPKLDIEHAVWRQNNLDW